MTGNLMTGRELAKLHVSWEQRVNASGQRGLRRQPSGGLVGEVDYARTDLRLEIAVAL
jgi:hypothetical protein